MPLTTQLNDRHIDRPANLIETFVSVHDRGKWVGDLDLATISRRPLDVARLNCAGHKSASRYNECQRRPKPSFADVFGAYPQLNLISVDNWDELLEAPVTGLLFVRANENWLGRFALTGICCQLGFKTAVLPHEVCWPCVAYFLLDITKTEKRIALIH